MFLTKKELFHYSVANKMKLCNIGKMLETNLIVILTLSAITACTDGALEKLLMNNLWLNLLYSYLAYKVRVNFWMLQFLSLREKRHLDLLFLSKLLSLRRNRLKNKELLILKLRNNLMLLKLY